MESDVLDKLADYLECRLERERHQLVEMDEDVQEIDLILSLKAYGSKTPNIFDFLSKAVDYLSQFEEM